MVDECACDVKRLFRAMFSARVSISISIGTSTTYALLTYYFAYLCFYRRSTWTLPINEPNGLLPAATGLVPRLTNIKRILGVSTYGATYPIVTIAGDNGRRMISTAIRPLFHQECACLWKGLYEVNSTDEITRKRFLEEVKQLVRDEF